MPEVAPTPTQPSPNPPVAYLRLMSASVLCMIMFGAVLVVLPVCLDTIGEELGINFESRGLLTSVRMAALICSLLVIGRVGEGQYKRRYLFWGLMAIGAAQAWGALAGGYTALMAAMVLSGLGKGVVEALVNPLVAQLHPNDSARALNLINGVFSVGLVTGALSAGQLLQTGHSWRVPFWLWVVPPMVCAVLFYTRRYPRPPAAEAGSDDEAALHSVRHFLRLPLFWLLVVAMIMGGGCEAGLTSWAPNFAQKVLNATPLGGAWMTAFYGAAMAVGRFASGMIVRRLTAQWLMVLSAVLCAVATLGLTFVPTVNMAYVLFALGGLFVACFWPTLLSVASDHISTGSTSLFSLLAAAGVGGCVVFPWAIGRLGDAFGLRIGMLVLPVSMVILLVMLGFMAAATRRQAR
ncbi:MAG: MFS transporter [Armatimonadetes bacterium]|nr:MFS transporter [Armatimonadota bacterium]